ncbi:MAG: polysaccharide deacetylase family protein [Kofleriaceae bacterium]
MQPTIAVSVDLDPLPCYYAIHALGQAPDELRDVVLTRGLPRLAELFARHGLRCTWFVVGADLDSTKVGAARATAAAALLTARLAAGDELGNHSDTHRYELARLGPTEVAAEIGDCDARLRALTGGPIAGFRAPGYDLSATMLAELAARGYRYDSSIFPAPGYYAAKLAVMTWLRLRGRPSGAVITNPGALLAPTAPYRPSMRAPWRRGQAPVVELPVAVTPWTRVPAIGTSLIVASALLREHIISAMLDVPLVNLEFHGIDLCDAELDGIPGELVARQPDLRHPLAYKLEVLDSLLSRLALGRTSRTLGEVATEIQRTA